MSAKIITQKRLKELLHYCPETGDFTRLVRTAYCVQIGDVAGGLTLNGYIHISIDGERYYAHRLAFLYMTGEWPIDQVDHDNQIRSDNRWDNLNQATYATNGKNTSMRSDNTSGVVGVSWHKQTWRARIEINGKRKHLGCFINIKDAIEARKAANIKYGFHQNHGL